MSKNRKQKVTLLGPVSPFRGGVSQYNTRLHQALSEVCELKTISFKRQYPKWLYPGKSDIDPNAANHKVPKVSYTLDAYNPLSLRRAADDIIASGSELAVVTMWTLFWHPGFAYISWRLRRHGIRTLFICHNVADHDARGLKKKVSALFFRQADGYLVHATEVAETLRDIGVVKPIKNMKVFPIYDHYPSAKGNLRKRGKLEVLFFGFIRPYKGLHVLAEALSKLGDKDIYLTVVGETWGNADELKAELAEAKIPNLDLHLEYVNDEQAAEFFDRADVVALPYVSASGSAVVTLAYHYRRPVLATSVGGLKDSVENNKTGWLVKPNSADEIKDVLSKIDRKKSKSMTKAIDAFCEQHSWSSLADEILGFIK